PGDRPRDPARAPRLPERRGALRGARGRGRRRLPRARDGFLRGREGPRLPGAMKPRILVVDDEPAILDNIQYALEAEGMETVRLSEGLRVPALLAKERIDLILLDVGLPDVSGLELCKEIRKVRATPIIFLTARTAEIDRVVGLEIGADDYVTKPFSPKELSARVKAVLRRTREPAAAPPAPGTPHGSFAVDVSRRRIAYLG